MVAKSVPLVKSAIPTHPNFIDRRGQKFGRLTVIDFAGKLGSSSAYKCLCQCGNETVVRTNLLGKATKSCGCLAKETMAKANLKHGRSGEPEANSHMSMLARCENPKHVAYKRYGGRGIQVCSRWKNGADGKTGLQCFLEDMGRRPPGKPTLERQNNDGNYEPGNCVWASYSDQAKNRRSKKV